MHHSSATLVACRDRTSTTHKNSVTVCRCLRAQLAALDTLSCARRAPLHTARPAMTVYSCDSSFAHAPAAPAGIGQADGRSLDLVITNTSEYTPKQPGDNGLTHQSAAAFGQINLLNDRRTDFRFCFVDSSTSEIIPVTQARAGEMRGGRGVGGLMGRHGE